MNEVSRIFNYLGVEIERCRGGQVVRVKKYSPKQASLERLNRAVTKLVKNGNAEISLFSGQFGNGWEEHL